MTDEQPDVSALAVIGANVEMGAHSAVWHFANIEANVSIGSHSVIGSHSYVGRGVQIGDRVRIQSFVSICRRAMIEDDVFISPHCCLTDDKYPRSMNANYKAQPPILRKGCSLGVGVLVMPGVTIGEGAMIGAGSVVTRNVPPHITVLGTPAKAKA
jgi:acetyltransferase-like isoleucine patch superfamily enzyme